MPRNVSRQLIGGALVALAACGTARVIQKTPYDGVIELQGDHNKAMEQANEEMAEHCGLSNFTINSAGNEAIGPSTPPGSSPAQDSTATAWRVHYQCGEGAPVGTAPPPSSPPPPRS
jgi:hypothetical protein